jgi:hypothetical protein
MTFCLGSPFAPARQSSIGIPLLYSHWDGASVFWEAERFLGILQAIGAIGMIAFSRKQVETVNRGNVGSRI